jgi:hypothetical protein
MGMMGKQRRAFEVSQVATAKALTKSEKEQVLIC